MKSYQLTKFQTLLLICALALLVRFYQLGTSPLSIDWDEASNAYNAYSILKTGRDEYGKFLPLFNRSFDDYKPPAYMYLEIPAVAIFGLTQFAARLPAALVGLLAVIAIYYLTKVLFNNEKIGQLSAFFLAVSPWHIQLTRAGFEAGVGLFAMIFALAAFIHALLKNKNHLLYFSALALGFSLYTYHSQRILVPILLISAILIYKKSFFSLSRKSLAIFFIIIIFSILPLLILTPKVALLERLQSTGLNNQQVISQKALLLQSQDKDSTDHISSILNSRQIILLKSYSQNYLENFSPNFLFVKGDEILRHHVEGMGLLYLVELPLIIYGLYLFIKKRNQGSLLLVTWLLIAPLPAAASSESPHAIRSMSLLIPLTIAAALALYNFSLWVNWRKINYLLILPILTTSFFLYLENYYHHYSKDSAPFWQYGYLQTAAKTQNLETNYQKIIVDSTIEEGYIFWLFQTKYDPKLYQDGGNRGHFGNFYFQDKLPESPNELAVSKKLPGNFEILDIVYYPDGSPAIQIGHPK